MNIKFIILYSLFGASLIILCFMSGKYLHHFAGILMLIAFIGIILGLIVFLIRQKKSLLFILKNTVLAILLVLLFNFGIRILLDKTQVFPIYPTSPRFSLSGNEDSE